MSEKYTIYSADILQYLTGCETLRTPLSDFYVRSKDCLILCAKREDGSTAGFLLAEGKNPCEIWFLTAEDNDSSAKRSLFDALADRQPSGTELHRRLKQGDPDEAFFTEYGFKPSCILHLFRSLSTQCDGLSDFIRDNEPLCAAAEQRGFETLSFDRLTKEQLRQISENTDGTLDGSLRPGKLMKDTAGGFSAEMSFAAVKDGHVAAYSLIRKPDARHCVFEILCAGAPYRRSGIFLLPLMRTLEAVRASGTESVFFAVYDHNSPMLTTLKNHFSHLIASHSMQNNMMYFVP